MPSFYLIEGLFEVGDDGWQAALGLGPSPAAWGQAAGGRRVRARAVQLAESGHQLLAEIPFDKVVSAARQHLNVFWEGTSSIFSTHVSFSSLVTGLTSQDLLLVLLHKAVNVVQHVAGIVPDSKHVATELGHNVVA